MPRWMVALLGAVALSCSNFSLAQAETSPSEPHEFKDWYIDPHDTVVRFFATELGLKKVKGIFNITTGTIEYDGQSAESLKVHAEIEVDTIDTGIKMRDKSLKSDSYLKNTQYPFIVFDSTRIVPGGPGHFRMYGNLKIRQWTKEVVLDVNGPGPFAKTVRKKTFFTAHATAKINRKDFGVNGGGPVIADELPITMIVRVIEGTDPELGTREDARKKSKEDFEQNEAFKKLKH
jgi:polyisoprenoid-binding protein YceI